MPNPMPNAYSTPDKPEHASGLGLIPAMNPPSYMPGCVLFTQGKLGRRHSMLGSTEHYSDKN
ncbi:hypothetical protein EI94DRAFT_1805001 [Lactarius quietus]|nr:hypothetical protein EI94DRAFT_1805001 [Lactarius quietus]